VSLLFDFFSLARLGPVFAEFYSDLLLGRLGGLSRLFRFVHGCWCQWSESFALSLKPRIDRISDAGHFLGR